MTNPRHVTTDIARAAVLLEIVRTRAPSAIRAITLNLSDLDGYPTTASGADRGPGGGTVSSSTERAALARLHDRGPTSDLDELHDCIRTARHALDLALGVIDRVMPAALTTVDLRRLRCIGTGDAAGSTCEQWADPTRRDGRCVDCGRRSDSDARRARRHAAGSAA